MGSEKFCLKWNDFETNISHAFRELRDDAELFDVTLACCDDDANRKLIQAHKVILSACSPFFRNMLRQNKAGGGLLPGNPLIYLRGVKHSDMEAVLSFMYQGEVNVPQDQLNSFLSVAEDLKVKGLTQNKSNDTKSEDILRSQTPNRRTSDPGGGGGGSAAKKPRLSGHPAAPTVSTADEDDDIQEVVPVVKAEPKEITAVARGGGGAGGGATDGVQSSAAQDIGYENQEEEYPDETYDESYDDYAAQYLDDSGAATGQMSVDNEKVFENLEEGRLTYSARGKEMLVDRHNYVYTKCNDKQEKKYWKCIEFRRASCHARAVTRSFFMSDGHVHYIQSSTPHNHEPKCDP